MVEFKGIYLRKFGFFFFKTCARKYNNIIELICIKGMYYVICNDTVQNEILRTKLYSTSTINCTLEVNHNKGK